MSYARQGIFLAALLSFGCSHETPKPPPPAATLGSEGVLVPVAATPPEKPAVAPVPVPDQIEVAVKPSLSVVTADKGTEMVVRIRLKGLPLANTKRPPINLALVIDTSGSMEGSAIDREREACAKLVDALAPGDAISMVTFGTKPRVVVPATRVDKESRERAKKAIAEIKAEGTTDMTGGLRLGLEQVRALMAKDGINRIVLVGDGVPNDPPSTTQMADQANASHIPITSLGLGPDFDETLMTSIATRTGGTFHFVDDASRVSRVFEQELSKMQRIVAHNTWVELTPGPGVVIQDVIGIPHTNSGHNVRFTVGEVSEGQVRDALVRVSVTARREGAKIELLDATAHYNHAIANVEMTAGEFRAITASKDAGAVAESRDPEVEHQGARLTVADNIVRAIAMARGGDVKGARALLDQTVKLAADAAEKFHDDDLDAKVKEVRALRKTVASLAPPPPPASPPGSLGMNHPNHKMRAPTPSPAAMRPEDAMQLRATHSAAMSEIQGL